MNQNYFSPYNIKSRHKEVPFKKTDYFFVTSRLDNA
nr:MAG TPA: hypothetical protein [Caudoviricetes sp.]DAR93138.1 MAG TPA: hypothetical protein [Caudoviricetes sp.]